MGSGGGLITGLISKGSGEVFVCGGSAGVSAGILFLDL